MRPRRILALTAAVLATGAVLFAGGISSCLHRAEAQRNAGTCEEAAGRFAREFFTPAGSQWVTRVAGTVVNERRPLLETIDPATIPTVTDPIVLGSQRQEGACDVTVSAGDLRVQVEVVQVDYRWLVDRWSW